MPLTEPPPTRRSEPPSSAPARGPLRADWRTASLGLVLLGIGLLLVLNRAGRAETGEEEVRSEAAERAAWAAALRQAPQPLGGAGAEGALEEGDAEAGGRFTDYYAFEAADSLAFSVVLTSDAFAPDLAVTTPGGRRIAASNLLRTAARAEVAGLRGPGRFEVAVTSVARGASGAYRLDALARPTPTPAPPGGPVRLDTLAGPGPRPERAYAIEAEPGEAVIVRVVSEGFAPRVHLFGPAGEVVEDRTLEAVADGGLRGVVLRYRPAFEAPYTLLVSSTRPGEAGTFALDVAAAEAAPLPPDGQAVRAELGPGSWLADGRYVDAYRFRVAAGTAVVLAAESRAFGPVLRLWRLGGLEPTPVGDGPGQAGRIERTLAEGGEYLLEVTSADAAGVPPRGAYTVSLTASAPQRAAPPPPPPGGAAWTFPVAVQRTGRVRGGSAFEVSVTEAAVSTPGGRTRVALGVSVRSVDYAGPWAPWRSFAEKATLVDDAGRRFAPAPEESRTGSGILAEPGGVRRGTVVFYADGVRDGLRRLTLTASLSADGQPTLSFPIEVPPR